MSPYQESADRFVFEMKGMSRFKDENWERVREAAILALHETTEHQIGERVGLPLHVRLHLVSRATEERARWKEVYEKCPFAPIEEVEFVCNHINLGDTRVLVL